MHNVPHSEATKLRISLIKKGKPSNRKGVKLSKETREKISRAKKGIKVHSDEQREKWKRMRKGEGNSAYKHGRTGDQSYWRNIRARRERAAPGFHSESEWQLLKIQYGFTCPSCQQVEPDIKLTKDHIIPLVKGGSHFIENIQPLCQSCNSKKHTDIVNYTIK